MEDLWGEIIMGTGRSPAKILREQAEVISEKTSGRVRGVYEQTRPT